MTRATRSLHRAWRALVDGLASTRLLRDKAGQNSAWWHYEHHARAWQRAQDRHERQRQRARDRHARHFQQAAGERRVP